MWDVQNRTCLLWLATVGLLGFSYTLSACSGLLARDENEGEVDLPQEKNQLRLTAMHELASSLEIASLSADDRGLFQLRPKPLFRYSDQPRGFVDATLWSWHTTDVNGRPAALAKIEAATAGSPVPYWHFCVISLSDDKIGARFEGTRVLVSTKAGIEFHPIPDAPSAADRPLLRQRQMKELVARFAATIYNTNPESLRSEPQEMRQLVTPIHRYAEPAIGLQNGSIFGLTTNGTNPDMLVMIELQGKTPEAAEWKYAILKLTTAEVQVRLDDKEVWHSERNAPRDTWDTFIKTPRNE